MFDHVIVATDGSRSAERAVRAGFDLAARFDATVCALSVVSESDDDRATEGRSRAERAEAAVRAVADRYEGPIETAVETGRPAAAIRAAAETQSADLVVTGTRGRDGEYRFLLGSVAEAVVRTCPVPVLTVRRLEDVDANAAAGN
jgi:nucleotide-binding universal stress UspA family protein